MAWRDDLRKGRAGLDEVLDIEARRRDSLAQDAQGGVDVRPRKSPIKDHVLLDGRVQGVALREPPVELRTLWRPEGHADAHLRPASIETLLRETLQDALAHMQDIRRSSVPIGGGDEELPRVDGLRLLVQGLLEGLLNPLSELAGPQGIDVLAEVRGAIPREGHRERPDEIK